MVIDEALLAVLLALYAHECVVPQAAGEYVFFGRAGRCRPVPGPMWSLASGNGYSFVNPVPSFGTVFRSGGSSFDVASARARRDAWHAETPMLRVLCGLLFAVVFGGVMMLSAAGAWSAWWPAFAIACVGTWAAVLVECAQTLSRLYQLPFRQIMTRCGTLLLSPIAAMRAVDVTSAPLLSDYHPAVAAYARCTPDEFHHVSRMYLHENQADGNADAVRVRAFLEEVSALDVVSAPPAREEGAVSYCPRCSSQFSGPAVTCADCGLAVREFGDEPGPRGAREAPGRRRPPTAARARSARRGTGARTPRPR